jgi:hypothetical protein
MVLQISSANLHPSQQLTRAAVIREKLEEWTATLGINALKKHQQRTDRNLDAEDAAVRAQAWDTETGSDDQEEGLVDTTILGDVTNPTPVVISQSGNKLGPLIAAALLGAGIPLAGVAGYLLSQSQATPVPAVEQSDESVDLGLGRIEDYVAEHQQK